MIKIKNLNFRYTENWLFKNLNLTLKQGKTYGILGKNGAGKTTLLKIITGQLFPVLGECIVDGYIPGNRQPGFLSNIFFLPEDFYLPPISPNLYKSLFSPFYPEFNSDEFYKYLNTFEVLPDKPLSSMSFGQKKKFLISFAIATNCKFLLLDEPTNALDIPSKTSFRRIIEEITGTHRLILISTHQVRDVDELIDPIVILDRGRILLNESMKLIKSSLKMEISNEIPEKREGIIYTEKVSGGYAFLTKGDSKDKKLDIEILFNAVISNPELISSILKNNTSNINRGEKVL